MKITLEYNIKAIISHVDIENGWLVIELTNPIVWINEFGEVKTMQSIFFGWDYLEEKDRLDLKNLITNLLENGYTDDELLDIIPVTNERVKHIDPLNPYDSLRKVPQPEIQKELIKAIKFAIVEKML